MVTAFPIEWMNTVGEVFICCAALGLSIVCLISAGLNFADTRVWKACKFHYRQYKMKKIKERYMK